MRVPIHIFSVGEFGVNPKEFCHQLKPVFAALKPDLYDVRAKRLKILAHSPIKLPLDVAKAYYQGSNDTEDAIFKSYEAMPSLLRKEWDSARPYRFRAVSHFKVCFRGHCPKIERDSSSLFVQDKAAISDDLATDIRKWPRTFTELSTEAGALSAFHQTLGGLCRRIHSFCPSIIQLNIVAHHVRVITLPGVETSNSPEGLHQDGFPFIVSALVVERENIYGAESEIYAGDKKTLILKTALQPGFGLLQPDLGSDLWHLVTPILGTGYRSSIGFDIEPIFRS
jgi:hypothetical protein